MRALLVVDLQNDFMPGGALGVPEGDQVVPVVNELMPRFRLVVATQDWHPPDHESFASQHPGRKVGDRIDLHGLEQRLWPDHCVQGTRGAALVAGLDRRPIERIFRKGVDRCLDSYSGFFDNAHRRSTGLGEYLRERGVTQVYIAGLATDYCVKYSALDALQLGFAVRIVTSAVRGVELSPGDCDRALREARAAGAELVRADEVPAEG